MVGKNRTGCKALAACCALLLGASSALAVPAASIVTNVTLNGEASVTVNPGDTITVAVTVNSPGNGANQRWRSTRYNVTGNQCVNTPNHQDEVATESFDISAPAAGGVYSIAVTAFSGDTNCSGTASNTLTLTDSITVLCTGNQDCDDLDPCTLDTCDAGSCDHEFQDADGDGVCDANDACPGFNDTVDTDGDDVADGCDACEGFDDALDDDGDGVPDGCDACPGFDDSADADADGAPDACDGCPDDVNKTDPGICGCGINDVDTDGDGTADCNDGCPGDGFKTDPGACGCGVADTDSDGNGIADCNDTPAPTPIDELCGLLNCAPGTATVLPMLLAGMGFMRRRRGIWTRC